MISMMKKYNASCFVVIFFLWSIFLNPAYSFYNSEEDYLKEMSEIKKHSVENHCGIFFIKLFSGYVPVPNRYVVSTKYKPRVAGGKVRFVSGKKNNFNPRSGWKGSIIIGKYSENLWKQYFDNEKYVVDRLEVEGLNVIKATIKGKNNKSTRSEYTQIIVYDEKEYIMIFDENPYLWKAMIEK